MPIPALTHHRRKACRPGKPRVGRGPPYLSRSVAMQVQQSPHPCLFGGHGSRMSRAVAGSRPHPEYRSTGPRGRTPSPAAASAIEGLRPDPRCAPPPPQKKTRRPGRPRPRYPEPSRCHTSSGVAIPLPEFESSILVWRVCSPDRVLPQTVAPPPPDGVRHPQLTRSGSRSRVPIPAVTILDSVGPYRPPCRLHAEAAVS